MYIRFSVIVVCYNAGDKLRDTIDSILEQTYEEYEIIIKDAMSTDRSLEKIPLNDKIKMISCKDQGIYDGMNQAVGHATGAYYIFLNCGDSFYNRDVLDHTAQLIKDRDSLIYYGDTFNEYAQSIVTMNSKITPFTCYRHIPCHQACFYAAELFQERRYDLHYKIRADYEHFLWSYFCKNANPRHLGLIVANYEGGGFSETKENEALDRQEHREITEKYMTESQLRKYRLFMIVTLMPIRKYLSRTKWFSGIYNGIKQMIYGE
ncbi:MAG: glycosyltransferase [Lachnospiraceae bacterium]|nr:glycosyltransferase [Lachnospiraceae bacterium]